MTDKSTSTFHNTVPGAVRCSSCLCLCAVPKPCRSAAFSAATVPFRGAGAWGREHRCLAESHSGTREMAEKEQEWKRFWFGPKSLVASLREWKQMPYKLTVFTMLGLFKHPPKAEDHHATGNNSMNYVQNLQGSLHNILHSVKSLPLSAFRKLRYVFVFLCFSSQ